MAKLTEKQKRFVEEYLVDLNATQAAIRAGYSSKTAEVMGYQLLQKTLVQAEIQGAMARRSARVAVTQDWVVDQLRQIAAANGSDFAKVVTKQPDEDQETGQPLLIQAVELVPTDDLPMEKRGAISGIEQTKNGIKVSCYDRVRALELLGKHLGMFDGKGAKATEENNLLDAITESSEEELYTDDLPEI